MAVQGTIVKVSGPLIVASGMADVQMFDVVRVSEKQLIGGATGPPSRYMRRPAASAPGNRWNPPARPCPWSWPRG